MGLVKREGIKQSIVNYIATAIGMVNVLYIYPKFLEPAELGLFQFIINAAMFLVPFSLFGLNSLVVKYFPAVENEKKKHNNFLSALLILSIFTFAIFFAILYFNKGNLGSLFNEDNAMVRQYFGLIAILVFLMQTNTLLASYLLNFKKIVIPAIMNQLIKIVIPVAVIIKAYYNWDFESIAFAILLNYSIIFIVLFSHLAWIGELKLGLDFSFFKPDLLKQMRVYAGFGLLGSLGSVLANRIDVIMVSNLSTLDFTAVYVIGFAIANVINIPISAINSITAPLISTAWHKNDIPEINKLYKSSSIVLLITSIFVFVMIWISIDDLYQIIPRSDFYRQGKIVVLLLGLAKIVDGLTSVNGNILVYSPKFKFNLYFMLILAVINTTLNVVLIPRYNIMGAALATMISIVLYNTLKYLFLLKEFKLSPFTKQTFYVLGLGIAAYGVSLILPLNFHPIVNIGLRSAIIGLPFLFFIYKLKLSLDFNDIVQKVFARFGIRI